MVYSTVTDIGGELFVVLQQTINGQVSEIYLNQTHFSSFLFVIKGIEMSFCNNSRNRDNDNNYNNTNITNNTNNNKNIEATTGSLQEQLTCEEVQAPINLLRDLEQNSYLDSVMEIPEDVKPLKVDLKSIELSAKKLFIELYAIMIRDKIWEYVKRDCEGCKKASYHLQDHDLCKGTKKTEKIDLYLNTILSELNDDDIRIKWCTEFKEDGKNYDYVKKEDLITDQKFFKMVRSKVSRLL